ncbi:hypothetical protein FISHEDRAFT_56600 [Fistulina hepatica ATCC 64428]|uniref:Uncharacterized protein n=1 Tax=Fistulina hepatica ATCC 64428 TaxID=1128425 RepID=A0A0D7AHU6_9AGAR|nr:hypothetical protein FISHEDRAFT_56600 [Fistulina hepatica ATCC 64428]
MHTSNIPAVRATDKQAVCPALHRRCTPVRTSRMQRQPTLSRYIVQRGPAWNVTPTVHQRFSLTLHATPAPRNISAVWTTRKYIVLWHLSRCMCNDDERRSDGSHNTHDVQCTPCADDEQEIRSTTPPLLLNYHLYTPMRNAASQNENHFVPSTSGHRQLLQKRSETVRGTPLASLMLPEEVFGYHTLVPLNILVQTNEQRCFVSWYMSVY